MSSRYLRVPVGARESAQAAVASGLVAVAVGLTVFYVARIFLSRDDLQDGVRTRLPAQAEE